MVTRRIQELMTHNQSSAENERRIQKDEIQDEFISNQLMLEEKEKDTCKMNARCG